MQNSRKVQMNNLKILLNNEELLADGRDWALLILRVIPSFYLFFLHGIDKITAGTETWDWLGGAVLSIFGISFGHVLFGMIAGAVSLSLKYVFMTGAFALLVDADHLLQFFNVEMISRSVHSFPFAIIIAVIMLYVFGKKDYRLAAISFSAILSHIAFDTWLAGQIYPGSTSGFPLLSPFTVEIFRFQGLDWLYLEILAIAIVGIIAVLDRKISIKNCIKK